MDKNLITLPILKTVNVVRIATSDSKENIDMLLRAAVNVIKRVEVMIIKTIMITLWHPRGWRELH